MNPGVNDNEVKATVNITSGTATGTLAIESGRAAIFWDSNLTAQALANTSTTQGGVVELPVRHGSPEPRRRYRPGHVRCRQRDLRSAG